MRKRHAIPAALAASLALSQPAFAARTGPEIAAVFDAGVAAYDAGDYEKAFKTWWDIRFEDVAAMRNLGMMLRKGQGTAKDPQAAEAEFLRAAKVGLPTAQADLADMLLKGEAGPPDLAGALPLLQAAAAANHPVAQFQLGQLYETGAPPLVPQNLEVARQLYERAATRNVPDAAARLQFVTSELQKKGAAGQTPAATVPLPPAATPVAAQAPIDVQPAAALAPSPGAAATPAVPRAP